MKHYRNKGTTAGIIILIVIGLTFILYQIIEEEYVIWIGLLAYFVWWCISLNNKTKLVKNKKTGHYDEVEVERSIFDQTDFEYVELNKQRKAEAKRQEKLSIEKAKKLIIQQKQDRVKIQRGKFEESGLMNKISRLKELYINGTLNKAEFEKAKNKLLK